MYYPWQESCNSELLIFVSNKLNSTKLVIKHKLKPLQAIMSIFEGQFRKLVKD